MSKIEITPTYNERAAAKRRKSQTTELAAFVTDVRAARASLVEALEHRTQMNRKGLQSVNRLRAAGLKWRVAADRNQYDMYFYDHAMTLIKPADKDFLTPQIVKTALHFAMVLKEPVTTAEQAAPLMQKCLYAFELEPRALRQLENEHPPVNIFNQLVKDAKSVMASIRDLEETRPMSEWQPDELDLFLREWKPVIEKYEEIARLRLGLNTEPADLSPTG